MRQIMIASFLVLLFAALGYGQTSKYEAVQVLIGATEKCGELPETWDINTIVPYHPVLHSAPIKYRTDETYGFVTLACEKTSLPQYKKNDGYGYVVNAAGSKYGFGFNGEIRYLGTADKQYLKCDNPVLGIWKIKVVVETFTPVVVATPVPTPIPPPHCVKVTDRNGNVVQVDLTLDQARQLGYRVDTDNQCYEPKPAPVVIATPVPTPVAKCLTVNGKPNTNGITIQEAIDGGWEVKDGRCKEVKESHASFWKSAACGAGVGFGVGLLKTRDLGRAGIGAGIGGVGGGVISVIPGAKTWEGCLAGGAAVFLPKKHKTIPQIIAARKTENTLPTRGGPRGGINGGGCVPGLPGCVITSSVPNLPSASGPTYPTTTTGGNGTPVIPVLTQPNPVGRPFAPTNTNLTSNQTRSLGGTPQASAKPQTTCGPGTRAYRLQSGETGCARLQ